MLLASGPLLLTFFHSAYCILHISLVEDNPAVNVSIEDLRAAWQLKHNNVSAGTPAYWDMRAVERDAIFTNEADNVSVDIEDDESFTPEEFTYPLAAWQAIYDLHGWIFTGIRSGKFRTF